MFRTLANIFRVPELRNKVLFTLMMLAIYRVVVGRRSTSTRGAYGAGR